jgi:hypothetical protein
VRRSSNSKERASDNSSVVGGNLPKAHWQWSGHPPDGEGMTTSNMNLQINKKEQTLRLLSVEKAKLIVAANFCSTKS